MSTFDSTFPLGTTSNQSNKPTKKQQAYIQHSNRSSTPQKSMRKHATIYRNGYEIERTHESPTDARARLDP